MRAYTLEELYRLADAGSVLDSPPRSTSYIRQGNPARRPDDRRLRQQRAMSPLKLEMGQREAAAIRAALASHAGHCADTARSLGISKRSFYYKCTQYGIEAASCRVPAVPNE